MNHSNPATARTSRRNRRRPISFWPPSGGHWTAEAPVGRGRERSKTVGTLSRSSRLTLLCQIQRFVRLVQEFVLVPITRILYDSGRGRARGPRGLQRFGEFADQLAECSGRRVHRDGTSRYLAGLINDSARKSMQAMHGRLSDGGLIRRCNTSLRIRRGRARRCGRACAP